MSNPIYQHPMTNTEASPKSWREFQYTSKDGLRLSGRKYGWQHRDRLPVLCLAGLTRNSADFHLLAMALANDDKAPRRVLCLDYRGRGNSEYDKNWENYNPLTEADDVIDGIVAAGLQHVAIVGTSRGALITLALAGMRPGLMKAVIFNDFGPEVTGLGLVRIKNYIDNASDPENWQEAAAAIGAIGAKHFPNWDEAERDRQARLIFKQENGKLVRRYDERLANTLASINLDQPLPTFWPQFDGLANLPMMVIRGENSDILSLETVEKMRQAHPGIKIVTVPDQGHAPELGSENLPQEIGRFLVAAEKKTRL